MVQTVSSGSKPCNQTFSEKERSCEFLFREAEDKAGGFWHVCTPGNLTEIMNISESDYKFAVSNMAISAYESSVIVITDNQMENHFHGLLGGSRQQCLEFVDRFRYRQTKYFASIGRYVDLRKFRCDDPIPITNLEMIRNEIVYINRNGFVSDTRFLPFSYPWGGGNLYFNPFAQKETGIPFNDIPFKEKRYFCRRRINDLPVNYRVKEGMILPASYVDYKVGESFFRDSHHYLNALTKNVEVYCQEAVRFADSIVLSREEMYPAVKMICERDYNVKQPSLLAPVDKLAVARIMHYDYRASNAQIRMILKMSEYEVNSLFPLKVCK